MSWRAWLQSGVDSAGWHETVIRIGRWTLHFARDTKNFDGRRFYQITIRRDSTP